jgi:hypothetical protein
LVQSCEFCGKRIGWPGVNRRGVASEEFLGSIA